MKIQYCSDLHLELSANYSFLKRKPIKPLGDILILAGDIIYLEERFFIHNFFDYCSANFDATYMICGNHEFYNGSDVSLYQKPICNNIRKNVFIVNNIQIPIKDVNFVFSTLWSKIDYKNSWEIKNRLNDFYKIKYQNEILSIDKYNELFKNSYGFINKAIRNNKFKKTVVVTHHAPSILCIAQEHKNSSLNDAFVVDLSKFIYNNNIDYWIYGHTHRNVAEVEINGTKIVTNQLGYVQMDEQSGFKNNAVIELK